MNQRLDPPVKLALDYAPIALFFLAYGLFGIFAATGVFMVATLAAIAAGYLLTRALPIVPVVSAVIVLIFGGMTLLFHDDAFIKMKVTIINALLGAALLGGLVFDRPILPYVLDSMIKLTPEGWRKLTFRWALFFFAIAILNEIVWRNVSTDIWVYFKLFGTIGLTLAFALSQAPLITRYAADPPGGRS